MLKEKRLLLGDIELQTLSDLNAIPTHAAAKPKHLTPGKRWEILRATEHWEFSSRLSKKWLNTCVSVIMKRRGAHWLWKASLPVWEPWCWGKRQSDKAGMNIFSLCDLLLMLRATSPPGMRVCVVRIRQDDSLLREVGRTELSRGRRDTERLLSSHCVCRAYSVPAILPIFLGKKKKRKLKKNFPGEMPHP